MCVSLCNFAVHFRLCREISAQFGNDQNFRHWATPSSPQDLRPLSAHPFSIHTSSTTYAHVCIPILLVFIVKSSIQGCVLNLNCSHHHPRSCSHTLSSSASLASRLNHTISCLHVSLGWVPSKLALVTLGMKFAAPNSSSPPPASLLPPIESTPSSIDAN